MSLLQKIAVGFIAIGTLFLFFFPAIRDAVKDKKAYEAKLKNLEVARETKKVKSELDEKPGQMDTNVKLENLEENETITSNE